MLHIINWLYSEKFPILVIKAEIYLLMTISFSLIEVREKLKKGKRGFYVTSEISLTALKI